MGLAKEFRDFAMRGNVIDMAVGIIIGAAFGKIVTALVDNILMPPIGYVTGGVDFKEMAANIGPVKLGYGEFINTIIQFLIIAFCLFLIIKTMNTAKARFEQKQADKPAEAPADVKLLGEIRDLLRAQTAAKSPGGYPTTNA